MQVYLGRPWRDYARTIFLRTEMSRSCAPRAGTTGTSPTRSNDLLRRVGSTGPGASPCTRAPWAHTLTAEQAAALTPAAVLGGADNWDPLQLNETIEYSSRTSALSALCERPKRSASARLRHLTGSFARLRMTAAGWVLVCAPGILFATVSLSAAPKGAYDFSTYEKKPAVWFATPEARDLAEHLLLFQDANGGWPKNRIMTLTPAEEAAKRKDPAGRNGDDDR